jgi:hypothetical protein
VQEGRGLKDSRTHLTTDNTGRGHIRIGCRDATGIMGPILVEGPGGRTRGRTRAGRHEGNRFRLGGGWPLDRRMGTWRTLGNPGIWELGRRIGRRIACGGAGARGLGFIVLDILLVWLFVIFEEDCMRKIWTGTAAGSHLEAGLRGVDLQRGKKGTGRSVGIGFKEIRASGQSGVKWPIEQRRGRTNWQLEHMHRTTTRLCSTPQQKIDKNRDARLVRHAELVALNRWTQSSCRRRRRDIQLLPAVPGCSRLLQTSCTTSQTAASAGQRAFSQSSTNLWPTDATRTSSSPKKNRWHCNCPAHPLLFGDPLPRGMLSPHAACRHPGILASRTHSLSGQPQWPSKSTSLNSNNSKQSHFQSQAQSQTQS